MSGMQQTITPLSSRTGSRINTDNDAAMLRLHRAGWPIERIPQIAGVWVDRLPRRPIEPSH